MSLTAFEFFSVPRIVFSRGALARLGQLAAGFGNRAVIVYNGGESNAERAQKILLDSKLAISTFRQKGEPTVNDIDRGLETARSFGAQVIIGLGGGSAIDTAKAVAGLLTNGGSALDYMEVVGKGQKIIKPAAPWIAIPTTAGTGAEATRNAVIGASERKFKASIRSEQLPARIALIDPELGMSTPPQVTASSGMDALCQLIESYTSLGAQPMTDALAVKGIELAARSLVRAHRDGADAIAREEMSLAALWSGITLTNAGLGAVHGFAAPLGANFPVPHGTICAALLPHVLAANISAIRARSENDPLLQRYAAIGRLLTDDKKISESEAIDSAIRCTIDLTIQLQIPPLSRFGLSERDIQPMVQLARAASSMRYNPIELSNEVLAGVLRAGIKGEMNTRMEN
ncbi:MAG TPA: iron-containing alcohol dehydrogenase [Humisphaera sp.]|jgi:alcohol dehydrogenase class IV|nr:iron-containing alcohol dehydrogenase [Humisphaera sp.]